MAALLEVFVLAILFYVRTCPHIDHLFIYSADIAVKPSASHQPTFSRDGEVAVATVAAIVNRVIVKPFWNVLYDDVNQLRYLIDIRSRERTGFTESVVRLAQSVE